MYCSINTWYTSLLRSWHCGIVLPKCCLVVHATPVLLMSGVLPVFLPRWQQRDLFFMVTRKLTSCSEYSGIGQGLVAYGLEPSFSAEVYFLSSCSEIEKMVCLHNLLWGCNIDEFLTYIYLHIYNLARISWLQQLKLCIKLPTFIL